MPKGGAFFIPFLKGLKTCGLARLEPPHHILYGAALFGSRPFCYINLVPPMEALR